MSGPRFRVVWVCGAPGAGKSAAAWSLFERSAEAGAGVAYVDIDQLGMLYPDTDDDPYRFSFKSAALDALIPGYAAAGAHTLIVSGVVDPQMGPMLSADVELAVCLISPDPEALLRRLLERGWQQGEVDEAIAEDASLRAAGFVDFTIETSGLSVLETAVRLDPFVDRRSHRPCEAGVMARSTGRPDVIVITGPRAVGTSTIGFGLAMRAWRAGQRLGFLDLQQLRFVAEGGGSMPTTTALAIGQLARMHRAFAEHGAERVVVSAHLTPSDHAALRAAFPLARVTIIRLRADRDEFTAHVEERAGGSGPRLAGDDLLDADESHQRAIVDRAMAEQQLHDEVAIDDAVVEVSRRSSSAVIEEVAAAT